MPLQQRIYFFDPANLDRFNSKDIPTEDTMRSFSESIPFIKEVGDRSMLTRAGIAKTTTDAKINSGDNTDAAGVSPSGFTTFVRPNQIAKMIDSASIVWTKVPRGGAVNTDTGVGIEDWVGTVQFPTIVVPEDTDDILTSQEENITYLDNIAVCSLPGTLFDIIPAGSPLQDIIDALVLSNNRLIDRVMELRDLVCASSIIDLGDIVMTTLPSSQWGSSWLEPNGQSLDAVNYPALFALIGYSYGGAAGFFNLPNLTTGNKYLRAKQGPPNSQLVSSGGSNAYTLTSSNIPLHTHNFTGNTTSDGAHTHAIPTKDTLGTNNSVRTGDAADGSFNLSAGGGHSHSIAGTTDAYGQNPPTPITIEPEYNQFYLKMKVR